jgi:PAS domain S-box-containing protein
VADGHQLPVRLRAQRLLLEEPGGEEGLIWLIVEDLQENLAAQEGLRLAASVFRDAQEGILITKPDGQIVEVNGAFSRITGYGREEVLGANPRLLKSGHYDSAFYARMWQQLNEEGTWSGEVVNRARDGATLEFFETISAVKDDNGSVSHYVALLTDISQLKQQQHQLERLAHFDALTGLPNRILLARRLEDAIAAARESGHRIAIGYLDLDGFKEVNDSLGHAAGDRLLQVLAARMQAALRPQDLLARLGGDEFVLLLREIPSSGENLPFSINCSRPWRSRWSGTGCRCGSPRALVSRSSPRAPKAWVRTSCCAMPTRPCTPPSASARTATPCPMASGMLVVDRSFLPPEAG